MRGLTALWRNTCIPAPLKLKAVPANISLVAPEAVAVPPALLALQANQHLALAANIGMAPPAVVPPAKHGAAVCAKAVPLLAVPLTVLIRLRLALKLAVHGTRRQVIAVCPLLVRSQSSTVYSPISSLS